MKKDVSRLLIKTDFLNAHNSVVIMHHNIHDNVVQVLTTCYASIFPKG